MRAVRWLVGLVMLAVAGCGDAESGENADEEVVTGTVINPLQGSAVRWIDGTYTNCSNRSGAWSARVAGTDTMDYAQLTVVKNDPTCQLSISALVADQTYVASPTIPLTTAYASSPSTFGTGSTQFAANAKLESSGYASDFQITFVYGNSPSDSMAFGSSTVSGGYAYVNSSASVTIVAAPTSSLDVSALHFSDDLINLVISLTGTATLSAGLITGDTYVVDMGTLALAPTYSQVATAYSNAISTQKTISGSSQAIQASEFSVIALSILGSQTVRTVIVKRTVGGIAAYQLFRVTFIS